MKDQQIPTTPAQQATWWTMQMGGAEASLALQQAVTIDSLDASLEAVARSQWAAVCERFPGLLARISADGLTRTLASSTDASWESLDWSALSEVERKDQLRLLVSRYQSDPMSYDTASYCRALWIRCSARLATLVLLTNLLVVGEVARHRLALHFSRVLASQSSTLLGPPAAAPQSDQNLVIPGDQGYWEKRLGQGPEALDIPSDFTRSSERTFRVGRRSRRLARDRKIDAAVADWPSFTLAAFVCFLQRLTGQDDVIVGVSPRTETGPPLLGDSDVALPFRYSVNLEHTGSALTSEVQRQWSEDAEHPAISISELLHSCSVSRDPARVPLTPVGFGFVPESLYSGQVTHLLPNYGAFELNLEVRETPDGLTVELTFNTDLFLSSTVDFWLDGYLSLLTALLDSPQMTIGDLPAISSIGRQTVLDRWGRGAAVEVPVTSVVDLFEAQAASSPDRLAVRFSGESLTYRQLDQRANFLSARLVELGVVPGDLVGVCVSRSSQMPAALLAVWKAGCAYVPLDPDFPPSRLAYILTDAAIEVLLTESSLADVFPQPELRRVWLDRQPGFEPASPKRPEMSGRLAYVLHTSGSTGNPKGVQIGHRNLVNFLASMGRDLSFTADEVVIAVTTLSFDIAGLEMFLPLVNGACIVVVSREVALDGHRLSTVVADSKATLLQATPATWQLLVTANWKGHEGFKALCGGEAFPRELAKELLGRVTRLWNVYGPTETTIWSTLDEVESVDRPISIGRPIDNTNLYLVDRRLQLVPPGATGELLIGGEGVGFGYWKLPQMTADKFIADPFASEPGARVYRTGDLCRFGADGRVYFQRRNDSQVKVRGYRIELGEIETALSNFSGVQQAVAMVRNFGVSDDRLVGYLVLNADSAVDTSTLRTELSNRLPSYMVPQHLVVLESWPLTPNGKIDRKLLPLPEAVEQKSRVILEPRTPMERELWNLWSELLQQTSFGVNESFFDLGGHSLLAAKLVGRVSDQWGFELSMRHIFQSDTIESLSRVIESGQTGKTSDQKVSAPTMSEDEVMLISASQQRNFFAANRGPGIAFRLSSPTPLEPALLRVVLERIVARHEPLRAIFPQTDRGVAFVVGRTLAVELSIENRQTEAPSSLSEGFQSELGQFAAQGFDLVRGPVCRFRLYSLGDSSSLLACAFSQVAFDGASVDLFVQELRLGYHQASSNVAVLPELPSATYRGFIHANRSIPEATKGLHKNWWLDLLGKEVPGGLIPVDFPRPEVPTHEGSLVDFTIDEATTTGLRSLSRAAGATLAMTLLSALFLVVKQLGGKREAWVAFPVAGRLNREFDSLLGTFTNMLLLPSRPSAGESFLGHLKQTRDLLLGAYDHQSLPLDDLGLRIKNPGHSVGVPLYQIEFNFEPEPEARSDSEGPALAARSLFGGVIPNEMTLTIRDNGSTITGAWEYNTALYDRQTIAHWTDYYQGILAMALESPSADVSEIEGLGLPQAQIDAARLKASGSRTPPTWWPKSFRSTSSTAHVVDDRGHELPLGVWGRLRLDETDSGLVARLTAAGSWERLLAPVPERAGGGRSRTRVLDPVEYRLIALFESVLGKSPLGLQDNFFDHGGHSALAVQILNGVNRHFRVPLALGVLFQAPTPFALASHLRRELGLPDPETGLTADGEPPESSSVVPIQPHGSLPPLFVAAGAGGNPMNLRFLSDQLGEDQPFYGLQHRGTDGRKRPHRRVSDMVDEYLNDVRKIQPHGPYYLGGFSSGGIAVFELARKLIAKGEEVALLIMLDAESTVAVNPNPVTAIGRLKGLGRRGPTKLVLGVLRAIKNRTKGWLVRNGLKAGAFLAHWAPYTFRNQAVEVAWMEAERNYQPSSLAVDVLVLRSIDRSMSTQDPSNGWKSIVSGQLMIVAAEGNHLTSIEPPHVASVARVIAAELSRRKARARSAESS